MDAKSQLKVILQGFKIIRKEDIRQPIIKYKGVGQHEWATYAKYETKAARDRAFDKLLEFPYVISD